MTARSPTIVATSIGFRPAGHGEMNWQLGPAYMWALTQFGSVPHLVTVTTVTASLPAATGSQRRRTPGISPARAVAVTLFEPEPNYLIVIPSELGKYKIADRVDALEPADARDHPRPQANKRKIIKLPLIAGMNPRRPPAAPRARRVARSRPDPERHQVPVHLDAVHRDGRELRQKLLNGL